MHIRKGSEPLCWHHALLARASIDMHLHTVPVDVVVAAAKDVCGE